MAATRYLTLTLACTLACHNCRRDTSMPRAEPAASAPTKDAAVTEVPMEQRVRERLQPLKTNPWSGWDTGTTVIRRFVPHGRGQGIQDYLQTDLTYTIVERGKSLERTQEVEGKIVAQSFAMGSEEGLPSPSLHMNADAEDVLFEIDGEGVPGVLRTSTLSGHATASNDGVLEHVPFERTTNEWTLKADDSILLRRDNVGVGDPTDSGDWWALTGLDRHKTIDGTDYLCIETLERVDGGDSSTVTTRFSSPDVPGHLVEELKEYYRARDGGTPWMVTVEQTVGIRR